MRINDNVFKCLNMIMINECNKTCEYCDIPTVDSKSYRRISLDDINYIDKILEYCFSIYNFDDNKHEIIFLGGELGLLSTEILTKLYDITIKYANLHQIMWMTNGLIFTKIPWILDTDINMDIHITDAIIDVPLVIKSNIKYTVVATKFNIESVNKIKTQLDAVGITNYHIKPCNSIRNGYMGNMEDNPNKIYKNIMFNKIDCNNRSLFFAMDFTNRTLYKCCRSYIRFERKPMTYDNIRLAFDGNLFEKSEICLRCKRLK